MARLDVSLFSQPRTDQQKSSATSVTFIFSASNDLCKMKLTFHDHLLDVHLSSSWRGASREGTRARVGIDARARSFVSETRFSRADALGCKKPVVPTRTVSVEDERPISMASATLVCMTVGRAFLFVPIEPDPRSFRSEVDRGFDRKGSSCTNLGFDAACKARRQHAQHAFRRWRS